MTAVPASNVTSVPWRMFEAAVARTMRLSPSFVRVTVTGAALDAFADNGFDQRFKLILPLPEHGIDHLPKGPDWYAQWRALPDDLRNPVRTYTVRAVRPTEREVDIDMVLHHDAGPAGTWASTAVEGATVGVLGPDRGFDGDHGGCDFRPHPSASALLLAGDETAAPAIASILACLDESARGAAVIEVPDAEDARVLAARTPHPSGVRVTWLSRDGAEHGSRLIPAVRGAAAALCPPRTSAPVALPDVDVDAEILWEVPQTAASSRSPYGWLAGEAGVIKMLRRHLISEVGLDRRHVAFMGYWRLGRAEAA